jgi:bifunctional UDP-N-acetylglucosamine pyrophosphorylase/glucosamine-1-phosphate N-acetyltransferase
MEILILAAGKSKRFLADYKKFLAPFFGMTVLDSILFKALKISKKVSIVVSEFFDLKKNFSSVKMFRQIDKHGTAAAVLSYLPHKKNDDSILIIFGDTPLLSENTMLLFDSIKEDFVLGVMSVEGENSYGRVLFENGEIKKIAEAADFKGSTEFYNSGIMKLSARVLSLLDQITPAENGELYLTSIIEIAVKNGIKIFPLYLNHDEAIGFNSIEEYHQVLKSAQLQWKKNALMSGAVFYDIDSVIFSPQTTFEAGAIIESSVVFSGCVQVGKKAHIRSFSYLQDCFVNCEVGPFARIRDFSSVNEGSIIGSFVEIKCSTLENRVKAKHLAYIGDCFVDHDVNIGAGTVICNYDGRNKHKTNIGSDVFIGGNSTLIAPIEVGSGAFLAAGGVYSKDIQKDEFSIARAAQLNKKNKLK